MKKLALLTLVTVSTWNCHIYTKPAPIGQPTKHELKGYPNQNRTSFDRASTRCITQDGNNVYVWNAKTGDLEYTLQHSGTVRTSEISPDRKVVLASVRDGRTIKTVLWNL